MLRTALFFLLVLMSVAVPAQRTISNQQTFKVEDGLPQSFVSAILQDKDGFIWASTSDGLARYDGRSFRTFSKKGNGSLGLSSSVIALMLPNGPDHFMIIYDGGRLADFDPVTFTIENTATSIPLQLHGVLMSPFVNKTYKTNNVHFYYIDGTGKGINNLDLTTGHVDNISVANGKLKNDTICGITQDTSGNLFIMTPQGLESSKDEGKSFELVPFRLPADATKTFSRDMLQMPDKSFVIIVDNKLLFLDPFKKKSREIVIPGGNSKVIRLRNMMSLDPAGRLYFEFDGNIFRLEKNDELQLLWTNTLNPDLRITSCFIDKSDVLWTSVDAQGLTKVNLRTAAFQSYQYNKGFFADVYEKAGIPKTKLPPSWLVDEGTSYFYYQSYGTDSTLYLFHSTITHANTDMMYWKNNQFTPLKFPDNKPVLARGISTSSKGEIWTADIKNMGLWFWKNKEAEPRFYPFDTTKDYTINGTEISAVALIGEQLWISSAGKGLFLFENGIMRKDFRSKYDATILPDNLTDICADPVSPDQLWIGSRGEGLILFNKNKGVTKIFTTDDGLPNNTIYSIVADQSGILWLSTNKGICRFDPKNYTSTSYVKSDGLAGNEFNRNHKFVFTDGRIALGGLEGYSIFNPKDFSGVKSSLPVPLKITHIFINNKEQDFSVSTDLVHQPFGQLKELELPYNENNLSVEFAALQFNEPLKIRYRYILEGADKTWRESGFNNIADYSQLRPGHYTLRMNATSLNGEWSSSILELKIIIKPPFWETWWAYLLYILIAAVLIRYYIISHKKRVRAQEQLAFEQKEAVRLKELDEMKDRFFSNITHEFRTPLTLILTPLEKLQKDQSLSPKAASTVQSILRNTRQLLGLINEFLDFSKLKNGRTKINLSNGDFSFFVNDIVQQFVEAAKEKNIAVSFSSDGASGLYLFDEEKWERIITNLLSNALKFTDDGGSIAVSLKKTDKDFKLNVSDSGIGIAGGQLQKVFDRFYQVNTAETSYGGTGIGLSLVKELALLMDGEIQVQSTLGKGASFTVIVPLAPGEVAGEKTIMAAENTSTEKSNSTELNEVKKKNTEKPLVMVAEDNKELQLFLTESLSDEWNIITSSDGVEAWEMIISEMPDVIISDVMMPGRDGFELLKLCKNDFRTAHIAFILLTSRAAHALKMHGLQTGADDYITKPFHLDELKLRVNNMLQLQQKQREFLQSQVLPKTPGIELPQVNDIFLTEFYKLLDDNIDQAHLNVDFIARHMTMSRSSLHRKLKNLLDISTNDLIKRYRLQKAAALLLGGNDITDTSYKVGFNTPSYFSHCFKEEYGVTPSEYVQAAGKIK